MSRKLISQCVRVNKANVMELDTPPPVPFVFSFIYCKLLLASECLQNWI